MEVVTFGVSRERFASTRVGQLLPGEHLPCQQQPILQTGKPAGTLLGRRNQGMDPFWWALTYRSF